MMTSKNVLFSTILSALLFCAHASLSAQQHGNPLLPHIVPLESCLPKDTISAKEHEVLSSLFNGARVIGLGEATHGTHEIFTMKHRLIKFLVESKGFKLIGLEAGMPEVEVVNRYILSDEGSAFAVVRQLGMWPVGTHDMLALVEWLRTYNKTQTNNSKVRLCGFDVQMTDSAAVTVTRFLRRVNPKYAELLMNNENYYQWLLAFSTGVAQNMWADQEDSIKQERIANADSVLRHFDRYRKQYEKATSPKECAWAERNAWLVSRAVRLFSSAKTRDSCMAENVSWLMKFHQENNIILWAHNGHIWCEERSAFHIPSMGWHLRNIYRQDYFALAITANQGIYCGAVKGSGLRWNNELLPPTSTMHNYVENYLHLSAIPQGFINFRAIKGSDYFYSWFTARQAMRFIGAMAQTEQFGYTYLLKNFDGLVFIDSTTAAVPLPKNNYYR